jgi:hypothetical protein
MKNLLYKLALKILPYSDILQNGKLYLRTFFVWRPKWSERLFGFKTGGIYIHQFVRSDIEPPHDHSWNFFTFILKGRYWDHRYIIDSDGKRQYLSCELMWPGKSAWRSKDHIHRVRLEDENVPVWTLMFVGPVEREFYFYTPEGPVLWWKFLGHSSKPL